MPNNLKYRKIKPQHRDSIFRSFFKIKENFIHALNHCRNSTNTLTSNDITPLDLDSNIVHRKIRNDVSFITSDNRLIIFAEHQTEINPNMALRLFMYYCELIQLWIKQNELNVFSSKKIENIPNPEFYVVYNGNKPLTETKSTFIINTNETKIEMSVSIIDIHFRNLKITTPDNALAGYSFLYEIYDKGVKSGLSREESFVEARKECIAKGYMKGYIESEEFELDYKNFMDYGEQIRVEAMEEGEAIGEAKGEETGILKSLSIAIKNNAPMQLIKAMAEAGNIPQNKLDKLLAQ